MNRLLLPCLLLVSLLTQSGLAEAFTSRERALFERLADPAFYVHPHRREAVAEGLAVMETMLAASNAYQDPEQASSLLNGPPSVSLRALSAGGGRAGEIARIVLSEAANGLYGDASQPLRGSIAADPQAEIEIRIQPGATRRLLLDTAGSGRLLFGSTCEMRLRELPRNAHGVVDVHGSPRAELRSGPTAVVSHELGAPVVSFGVASGPDCGSGQQTLLVAWAPSPPRLSMDRSGTVQIRQPGRFLVPLSEDTASLVFDLPAGSQFRVSSPTSAQGLWAEAPSAMGVFWVRGGSRVSGHIEHSAETAELLVEARDVPRLAPGDVLRPDPGQSEYLFEVAVPTQATGYLSLLTLEDSDASDPLLRALDSQGDEIASDDDSGPGLNAALVVPVPAGGSQLFMLLDLSGRSVPPVAITLSDSAAVEPHDD